MSRNFALAAFVFLLSTLTLTTPLLITTLTIHVVLFFIYYYVVLFFHLFYIVCRLERIEDTSAEQQLLKETSGETRSQASSIISKPVNLNKLLLVPTTR